jgi:hypothetical protein
VSGLFCLMSAQAETLTLCPPPLPIPVVLQAAPRAAGLQLHPQEVVLAALLSHAHTQCQGWGGGWSCEPCVRGGTWLSVVFWGSRVGPAQ